MHPPYRSYIIFHLRFLDPGSLFLRNKSYLIHEGHQNPQLQEMGLIKNIPPSVNQAVTGNKLQYEAAQIKANVHPTLHTYNVHIVHLMYTSDRMRVFSSTSLMTFVIRGLIQKCILLSSHLYSNNRCSSTLLTETCDREATACQEGDGTHTNLIMQLNYINNINMNYTMHLYERYILI